MGSMRWMAVLCVLVACGDPKASFRAAILDPVLTVSQPRQVTATFVARVQLTWSVGLGGGTLSLGGEHLPVQVLCGGEPARVMVRERRLQVRGCAHADMRRRRIMPRPAGVNG